jgi:hypothetical protein
MEWVCVYLTLVKNLPVLSVRDDDYKTEVMTANCFRRSKGIFAG